MKLKYKENGETKSSAHAAVVRNEPVRYSRETPGVSWKQLELYCTERCCYGKPVTLLRPAAPIVYPEERWKAKQGMPWRRQSAPRAAQGGGLR